MHYYPYLSLSSVLGLLRSGAGKTRNVGPRIHRWIYGNPRERPILRECRYQKGSGTLGAAGPHGRWRPADPGSCQAPLRPSADWAPGRGIHTVPGFPHLCCCPSVCTTSRAHQPFACPSRVPTAVLRSWALLPAEPAGPGLADVFNGQRRLTHPPSELAQRSLEERPWVGFWLCWMGHCCWVQQMQPGFPLFPSPWCLVESAPLLARQENHTLSLDHMSAGCTWEVEVFFPGVSSHSP